VQRLRQHKAVGAGQHSVHLVVAAHGYNQRPVFHTTLKYSAEFRKDLPLADVRRLCIQAALADRVDPEVLE
jgi:hypothetical protein